MRIAYCVSGAVLLSALPFLLSSQDGARARPSGYLTAAAMPDLIRVLPSAPEPESGRDAADRAIFKATRSLQDSARWKLAQNDDALSVTALLADFQCSVNLGANSKSAPVRDSFAHPKVIEETLSYDGPPPEMTNLPTIDWEEDVDVEKVRGDYDQVEAYRIRLLDSAAGVLDEDLKSGGWKLILEKYPHLKNFTLTIAEIPGFLHNTKTGVY